MKFNFKNHQSSIINHQSESGFTLIELLMAMSIVMILSAVTVVNIRTGSSEQALLRSAQTLAFNIRKAQNLALAPQLEDGQAVCYYGIKVDNNDSTRTSYFLYYNDKNNCTGAIKYNSGQSVEKDRFYLEKGVEFALIANKDVAFVPPEPIMYFNGTIGGAIANSQVPLRLKSDFSKTRNISINKIGKITIQ